MEENKLQVMRHSCSHIMASAVKSLYSDVKLGIGPAIDEGFYYDFDLQTPLEEQDLEKIEKEMQKIIDMGISFEKEEISIADAKELFKDQHYKLELIDELEKSGNDKVTIYKSGDFTDLCVGPHLENSKEIGSFKLLSLAGAYWRGNEKNKMMTRIYGTSFATKEELETFLQLIEEAKKRDHRKLGPQLGIFLFDETAPGMPYWLNNGMIIYNELINFWRQEHKKRNYEEIKSPLLNKKELYETSGHWDHYREDMFIFQTEEKETYCLKPMNCPNAMVVFASKTRSYRELPLRLGDTDTLHRNERSGTLNGLLRVREFTQDDAHIFVTEQQIQNEYKNILDIAQLFYSVFKIEYSFRLGTRPEKFMGDPKIWDKAEEQLKLILKDSGQPFKIEEGDGAFYGPKIDILMKDVLGREWQTGTIQLDFQIPQKFDLKYTDEDGKEKTPVVIHRVIYGSLERFIGILIEHYAGAFPTWLAPVQIKVIPITDKQNDYAQKVAAKFDESGIRVEVDDRSETTSAKIRDAEMEKVPYMVIVGGREEEAGNISVRARGEKNLGNMVIGEFLEKIKTEIENKE